MVQTWLLLALSTTMLYGISQVAQKKSLVVIPAFGVISLSIVVATADYLIGRARGRRAERVAPGGKP